MSLQNVVLCALDDTRSSSCGEETEKESIPDGNHNSSVIGEEEQEDWDNTDEVSYNFDPTCKFFFT